MIILKAPCATSAAQNALHVAPVPWKQRPEYVRTLNRVFFQYVKFIIKMKCWFSVKYFHLMEFIFSEKTPQLLKIAGN